MKLRPEFIARKIVNDTVLMDMKNADRLLRLNETAAEILSLLEAGKTEEEMVSQIVEMYEIDAETAARDVAALLSELHSLGALTE